MLSILSTSTTTKLFLIVHEQIQVCLDPSLRCVPWSSSAIKCSLATTQIGMLMFLMNWAVVPSSSVDPHSLSFKVVPGGRMRILSGAWVGKFRKMCSGSWTPVPQGQLFVWETLKRFTWESRRQWPALSLKMMGCYHLSRFCDQDQLYAAETLCMDGVGYWCTGIKCSSDRCLW